MDFTNNVIRFETLDSTNRFLASEALAGAVEGTVCVADYQTSGRGRTDRSWESPPAGGLLCSVLFRPSIPIQRIYIIPIIVGLAILDSLEKISSVSCAIKWPNDIVYNDKKLGGMLSEVIAPLVTNETENTALVVGFGINCSWPRDFNIAGEKDISLSPITLEEITGINPDKNVLLEQILHNIQTRYEKFLSCFPQDVKVGRQDTRDMSQAGNCEAEDALFRFAIAPVMEEYRSKCATINKDVRVIFRDKTVYGHALDIDGCGRLLVETNGTTVAVDAADIVHLRQVD